LTQVVLVVCKKLLLLLLLLGAGRLAGTSAALGSAARSRMDALDDLLKTVEAAMRMR